MEFDDIPAEVNAESLSPIILPELLLPQPSSSSQQLFPHANEDADIEGILAADPPLLEQQPVEHDLLLFDNTIVPPDAVEEFGSFEKHQEVDVIRLLDVEQHNLQQQGKEQEVDVNSVLKKIQSGEFGDLKGVFGKSLSEMAEKEKSEIENLEGIGDLLNRVLENSGDGQFEFLRNCLKKEDVLSQYENDRFSWNKSFVEQYMFRSMGIAYPSEKLDSSVFETQASFKHRTSITLGTESGRVEDFKEFIDEKTFALSPRQSSNALSKSPTVSDNFITSETLSSDVTPLQLHAKVIHPRAPAHEQKASLDFLNEAIEGYIPIPNNKQSFEKSIEEKSIQEHLLG
jgi:hypothetical protein